MDIYWAHVAQYRWHTYTAPDGTPVEDLFDPAGTDPAENRMPTPPGRGVTGGGSTRPGSLDAAIRAGWVCRRGSAAECGEAGVGGGAVGE